MDVLSYPASVTTKGNLTRMVYNVVPGNVVVKGACSDPQPHPQLFFSNIIMEIFVPKVESYLEGFMCEIVCTKLVQLRRNQ